MMYMALWHSGDNKGLVIEEHPIAAIEMAKRHIRCSPYSPDTAIHVFDDDGKSYDELI